MNKRNKALIAAGLAVVLAAGFAISYRMGMKPAGKPTPGGQTASFFETVDLASAPADVQDAAAKLATSRVGYAIVHPDKTYLIISTGSPTDRVMVDTAQSQVGLMTATLVDVQMKSAPDKGSNLMIVTAPRTDETDYQFNVDGKFAAIPTLHNPDRLPLVYLDAAKRFSVIAPTENQVADGGVLHVAGYAQVFEAQFSVTLTSPKGRILGTGSVKAAAGAPAWGSFTADIHFDTANLPDTGFVTFEAQDGARVTVPITFRHPAELG